MQTAGVRGVHEYHIKGRVVRLFKPGPGIGVIDAAPVAGIDQLQCASECAAGGGIPFHKQRFSSASGKSLEAEYTGTGAQIQNPCTWQAGLQPVEQGFPGPVRSRTKAFHVRHRQLSAPPLTTDDADLAGPGVAFTGL